MRRLLGPGFFITERWLDCATRTAKRLESELAAARAENEALRRCVEAAKPIVRWVADNFAEGIGDELDHWDLALSALRSGKD